MYTIFVFHGDWRSETTFTDYNSADKFFVKTIRENEAICVVWYGPERLENLWKDDGNFGKSAS
jgi:hypothetical protein